MRRTSIVVTINATVWLTLSVRITIVLVGGDANVLRHVSHNGTESLKDFPLWPYAPPETD